jgi:hypothetical protein
MTLNSGRDIIKLIQTASTRAPGSQLALGYVTTVNTSAGVAPTCYVTFDEDLEETLSAFPVLNDYAPAIGDRVLLQKVNGKWVILGSVAGGADPWHALTMAAGWANYAAGTVYESAGYRLDAAGYVKFKGLIIPPAAGTAANTAMVAAGTLPVGYRPALHQDFPLGASNGVAYTARVLSTGAVLVPSNIALPAGVAWLSLAAIHYQVLVTV